MNKAKLLEDAIASIIYDYECDNDDSVTSLEFTRSIYVNDSLPQADGSDIETSGVIPCAVKLGANNAESAERDIEDLIFGYEHINNCKVSEVNFTPRRLAEEVNYINTKTLMKFRGRLITAKISVKIEGEIMNIVNYILNAKDDYTCKTGRNPTTIYLGHKEFKELKNSDNLKLNAHYCDEETKLIGGRFIFGLKVIEVNQPTHFNII